MGAENPEYCLVVDGNNPYNGANVQLWTCDGSDAQNWYIPQDVATGVNAQHNFAALPLNSSSSGGLDPAVLGGSSEDVISKEMATVDSSSAKGLEDQRVSLKGTASVQIQYNLNTEYCLSVDNNNVADGANMQLWKCSGGRGQYFDVDPFEAQAPIILSGTVDSPFCVVIDNNEGHDGQNIQLWSCDFSTSQSWILGSVHGSETYQIKWAENPEYCLVVDGNNAYNGANVQLGRCDGSDAQNWYIPQDIATRADVQVDFAALKLNSSKSGGLHPAAASAASEELATADKSRSAKVLEEQRISLRGTAGVQIQYNADTEYCLSVDNNNIADGANMQLWKCSGGPGQYFDVDPFEAQAPIIVSGTVDSPFCVVIDNNEGHDGQNIQLWSCDFS